MPNEYIGRQIKMSASKDSETAYNTLFTTSSAFRTTLMEGTTPVLPMLGKLGDGGKTGHGQEGDTKLRNNYWEPFRQTVGEDLETDHAAMWLFAALGGTQADVVPSGAPATAKDHTCAMQTDTQGRQLPSRTVAEAVGGIDYIFGGVCVNEISLTMDRADNPVKWQCQLVGSGYHKKISDVTPTLNAFPAITDRNYTHAAASDVSFTPEGGALTSLGTEGRLRGFQFSLNNNLKAPDRRPKDGFLDPLDPFSGAYQKRLLRQARAVGLQVTISVDENDREFQWMKVNKKLNGFKILVQGAVIETGFQHEVELTFPTVQIIDLQPGNDGEDLIMTIIFKPLWANGSCMSARVRNANATGVLA